MFVITVKMRMFADCEVIRIPRCRHVRVVASTFQIAARCILAAVLRDLELKEITKFERGTVYLSIAFNSSSEVSQRLDSGVGPG